MHWVFNDFHVRPDPDLIRIPFDPSPPVCGKHDDWLSNTRVRIWRPCSIFGITSVSIPPHIARLRKWAGYTSVNDLNPSFRTVWTLPSQIKHSTGIEESDNWAPNVRFVGLNSMMTRVIHSHQARNLRKLLNILAFYLVIQIWSHHRPALQALPFTESELLDGFYKLPATKALAPNGFPAIVWKAIAHDLTPILYKSLYDHYCRQNPLPPEHWSAGWLHLLAKPGKACNRPEALRPICLQHPVSKVVSGILTQRVMDSAYPQLRQLPLYAYLPGRSTADCLLLTSAHCRAVREACQQTRQNLDRHNLIGALLIAN